MAYARSRSNGPCKSLGVAVTFAVTVAVLSPMKGTGASAGGNLTYRRAERCLMRKTNAQRLERGLARLRWDKHLTYVARRHARSMAEAGSIWHDGRLGDRVTRWVALGQNTGHGESCRFLFRAFMRSSDHRRNVLGRWRFQGVGIAWRGGHLYLQHVFEHRRNPGNIYHYP